MADGGSPALARQVWPVGALCRAVADALEARFNPVAVRGEISGFSRAASGHCYFSLKDESGQLRCAMFRRAAGLLDFAPRDGEQVEVRGRLAVYEPRGDLQLVVESMSRAGQGALFEQFLQLKARLQAQGLFDAARKRMPVPHPRGIGLVTSTGAAALHDVVTALRRRVPHIPVVLAPAAVQGAQAAGELVAALSNLYQLIESGRGLQPDLAHQSGVTIDVILLVRGGGSIEDLAAFNDEQLAHTLLRSPVPVICGVGHETDFTIADFVADLRAPTPTAAAELAAEPRQVQLEALDAVLEQLRTEVARRLDAQQQRLDQALARLGRPSGLVARQQLRLAGQAQRLRYGVQANLVAQRQRGQEQQSALGPAVSASVAQQRQRLADAGLRLELMAPQRVLERGYAILQDDAGRAVTRAAQTRTGQALRATLADGEVDLAVTAPRGR